MGWQSRRLFCGMLFWAKTTLAVAIAFAVMGILSLRVYTMRKDAMDRSAQQPINTPIKIDGTTGTCAHSAALGRLEPPKSTYIGYSPNWSIDVPSTINSHIEHRGAVFNAFLRLYNDPAAFDRNMMNWHAEQVIEASGILMLTIEPVDMGNIGDAMINTFAGWIRELNEKGCPIIMRYGHEMNGDWTNYGYKPNVFIPAFRKMAAAIHAQTNVTAMLWSPNVGSQYPYTAGADAQSPWQASGPENIALLDTNRNGVVDAGDDPYTPYYPGDEYVDWVGLSLYYYQDNAPNKVPGPTFFEDYFTGNNLLAYGAAPTVDPVSRNFYQNFAVNRKKPVALSESGAGYLVGGAGDSELEVKRGWWQQTLNPATLARYPELKLIVNFEEAKAENGFNKDWAVTHNPAIRAEYAKYLSSISSNVLFSNQLRVDCAGAIKLI
ncbi:glycoside hydrolase superfamily [Phlyctochytrium arcticum]|nr:glycoside hydrolase superfamily [Phlyctochytrium arcticum]